MQTSCTVKLVLRLCRKAYATFCPILSHYLILQVLFPNEAIAMILARMVGILGPIDTEMLENGNETHKYFTKDYDLYYINEVCCSLSCF